MRSPSVWCALLVALVGCSASSDGNTGASGADGSGGGKAGSGGSGPSAGGSNAGASGSGGTTGSGGGAAGGATGGSAGDATGGQGGSAGATGAAGTGGRGGGNAGGSGAAGNAAADGGRTGGPEAGGPPAERADGALPGGSGTFGYDGPSRCATAGVPFCDGFEDGLNATTWTTTKSGDATIVVETGRAARGTGALHVKTTNGSGHAYITERMGFPATNNIVYGRMFVYFVDPLTTGGHFSLAEGGGTGNSAVIRFGGQNNFFGVGTDGGASGDWTDKDNKLVPAATWICTEFQMKGDTNEFHVWKDDVALTTLNTGVARHAGFAMPTFNHMWFGWWMYNATEAQELWIDEVAVDYKPIGCAK
jgi:hypothetical protein